MEKSSKLQGMVDQIVEKSKRKRIVSATDSFSSDSPMKRRFVVRDESTSDSE